MKCLLKRFSAILLIATLAACGGEDRLDTVEFEPPETQVTYEIVLEGLPTEEMTALAEESLEVYRRQDAGAMSLAFLKRRARGDVKTVQKLLRSRGYFKGKVEVKVTEVEGTEEEAPEEEAPEEEASEEEASEEEAPEGSDAAEDTKTAALVRITVTPGNAFTLTSHGFILNDPSNTASLPDATAFGSPVGKPAAARAIVDAETGAAARLTRTGFPYAKKAGRDAEADLEAETLRVDTVFDTGPAAIFGPVEFRGLDDVHERYLRTYIPWGDGEVWDARKLIAFQRALIATDLFATISVKPPAEAPIEGGPAPLPVIVEAEERPFRTVSAGAAYSTDDGPSVKGGFEHRNLFGENETLNLQLFAGLQRQYFGVGYREPQFGRPGQDLIAGLTLEREEDDAFDELTVTAAVGLERRLNAAWVIGAGVSLTASDLSDEGRDSRSYLFGTPAYAAWDVTDDLLNPTRGGRARFEVTPYAGVFDNELAGFLTIDTRASAYFDLTGAKDYIFAVRGRLGAIVSDDVARVPPNLRLYAGGGGSVRGYAERFVGPLDGNNDPEGGRSAVEIAAELRAKIYGDLGGVLFVEAGAVSVEMFPNFDDGLQLAAGFGFRYFTVAGPIRVDVAFPLNPRDADDFFQLYFSIGQAF